MTALAAEVLAPRDRITTMPSGVPEITLGWEAIYWATKYLKQPDGDGVGEAWKFILSQKMFVLWWYSIDDDTRWRFYHGVRRLAKGSGKSPFAAVMALLELLAPVRFKKWCTTKGRKRTACVRMPAQDRRVYVVGRRVGMPLVQIAATAESQANVNTMRMVRALVPPNSRIRTDYKVDTGMTIFYVPGGGQLMIVTSSATAAEGALVTYGVLDQTESWTHSNGGVDLAETMDRNAGKSKSRLLETANAWNPGQDSVAETTFEAWVAQEEGRLRGTGRILYDARLAPHDTDFEDDESLQRGVEFTYGDCYWVDTKDIVQNRILSPRTPLSVSKRFYLNWTEAEEDAWTTQQE